MSMSERHTMRDGTTILIRDMDDRHLLNTIRLFKKKAREGVQIWKGGGYDSEDFWCETYTVTAEEAEEALNLDAYTREAQRRGLSIEIPTNPTVTHEV